MRDVFIAQLLKRAKEDSRIILLTGDLGFRVFDEYIAELPEQFLNVGVAEQNMAGIAAGLAHEGHVVFTYSIGNFVSLRCLEQIRNDICYHNLNVNVVCIGGGLSYGALGASHHATEDIAIMRALPGMKVICPGDRLETTQLTDSLIDTAGPAYFRLERGCPDCLTEDLKEGASLGKARTLLEGKQCTLIGTGGIMAEVYAAALKLRDEQGIECRVLSVHTVSPLDSDAIIAAARETDGLLVIEEHRTNGGLKGAVSETLLSANVSPGKFQSICLDFDFCRDIGSQSYLRGLYGLSVDGIVSAAQAMVGQ